MTDAVVAATTSQIQSTVTDGGEVRIALVEVDVPAPRDHEVVVAVAASPINPSDLGLLLAGADPSTFRSVGTAEWPVAAADLPDGAFRAATARLGQAMPVGNEAGGVVVAAGASAEAQALLGRTVGVLAGSMYTGIRVLAAQQCLALHEGTDPRDGASCFVNPLTALGMVETMRREGHTALVHTAAASNLGQMLNRICLADGVTLVNVVRRPEQAELLRSQGAVHVCDSSAATFGDDLVGALRETKATIAFDATGGGKLASRILAAMEAAAAAGQGGAFNRYGSTVHKQVYIYGALDRSPTELNRTFGMAWGVGGWLLTNFLNAIGPEADKGLRQRVADELTTTFASSYGKEISLVEALDPAEIREYGRQATGQKYLIRP